MDDILLIFMNTAMLNASSIRFRQLIDVSDWRHRIPQWGHKQFWIWICIKIFFLFIYAFSSHSIFKISNSKEEFSIGLLIYFLPKFCHPYFPLIFLNAIPVTFWAFKPDMFAWYLIQIVCFDTLTLLSSWFFVIYLLLNGKTLGGNEWVFL